jgi:predicted metal-binding membrane protein
MSDAVSPAAGRPILLRVTPQVAALCLAAAVAWFLAVREAVDMGNGPGTMGLGVAGFLGMWTLMMSAMMLPSVAPVASMHARTIRTRRASRLAAFTAGYLAVWVAAGIPAFGLLRLTGAVADGHDTLARAFAAAILVGAGLWQLSGVKDRCLAHCRSPFGLLLHYGSYKGRFRDVRAAIHHAAFCLGCCWSLMALFAVFGIMNIGAMVVLAVIVLLEKLWGHGTELSRLIGVACIALAIAALAAPGLTPGLHVQHAAPMQMPMG